ncbi:hypothetical protein LCGC14_0722190 [marine sediment metagenome]|uniref:Uncharacterized protein n=1 Tax=marine sediment metagenome TaxID=412755 RepID=A0A0F9TJD8_9ZZZZ
MIKATATVAKRDGEWEGEKFQAIHIDIPNNVKTSAFVLQDKWDQFSLEEKKQALKRLEGSLESAIMTWISEWYKSIGSF